MPSPTQRTLNECRKRGWLVEVTERWNQFARIRQDLFGFCDVLAIRPEGLLAIQATSATNMYARIDKLMDTAACHAWLAAGQAVEVWGWEVETANTEEVQWITDDGLHLHVCELTTERANDE